MVNDSDAEEYGEEWEEQEESGNESDGREEGLSVHPLPRSVGSERSPVHCDELKKNSKPSVARELLRGVLSDNDTASDSGEPRASECSVGRDVSFPESVVRLHARRVGQREAFPEAILGPAPPPVPVTIDHIGVRAAAEARRRLHEYRRERQEKEESVKMREAAESQQMKQVRRMYKTFNQSIGVADIPPDKRYKEAMRRSRVEKQKADAAVSDETANRWYRGVKRQSRSAVGAGDYGARILDEARREHRSKLHQKANERKEVEKKLEKLSLDAKRIAAKTTLGYERGSYILRATSRKQADNNEGDQPTTGMKQQ